MMAPTSRDNESRTVRIAIALLVALAMLGTPPPTPNVASASGSAFRWGGPETQRTTETTNSSAIDLAFPIRAAFYYPWYPAAWSQKGVSPYTVYQPSRGYYDGGDPEVIAGHIADMQYGNIQVGIASWWGQGSREDLRMPELLRVAEGTGFLWAVYYEAEGTGDPTATDIQADLAYIRDRYAMDPAYARINGRFVVFVYGSRETCDTVDRWTEANTVDAWIVLKVFPGYTQCAHQPDGWHQYAPAQSSDQQGQRSFSISPGFHLSGEPERLPRDLHRWQSDVQAMIASNADWQLVTTFNEWGEGTAIESATEWASASGYGAYLDVLHRDGNDAGYATTAAAIALEDNPPYDKQKRSWLGATTVSFGRKRRDSNPRSQP